MPAKPLRILIATPRSPLEQGGVERHVLETSRRFAAAGAQVRVLCGDPGGPPVADVERDRVLIRSLRAYPAHRDWVFAPRLWPEIAAQEWDILHVQSYHTFVAPLAMLGALAVKLPYVVTFHAGGHSSELRNRGRPLQLRVLRPLLARAERLIAVARYETEHYARELRLPRGRFELIPNGVEFVALDPAESERVRDPSTFASIGRLERYKGHHRVIAALARVLESRPDARLLIVGSGPYEAELRSLAASTGVEDRVLFTSTAPGDANAMAKLLARTSLVVLMSEHETHPLVALEAAASGRRLLVADRGGLLELAHDGLARAIALDASPEVLGDAILEELAAPAPTNVPELQTWDQCAEQLLELYRSIIDGAAAVSARY